MFSLLRAFTLAKKDDPVGAILMGAVGCTMLLLILLVLIAGG